MRSVLAMILVAGIASAQADVSQTEEVRLNNEIASSNGIYIGTPKVYDDALLREMLAVLSARLAAIAGSVDGAKVNAALGTMSGATLSSSSFGLSLFGGPSASVVTVAKGPTATSTTTTVDSSTTENPGSKTIGVDSATNVITSGAGTTDTTTTRPSVPVPFAGFPAPTTSLPTSFGVSASDILNEQVQVLSEISNLRLLVDGALTEQIIQKNDLTILRKRITVGVPVSLAPLKKHKDLVAIIEVKAVTPNQNLVAQPPSITALLPRDKTYNVASITDRNLSLSGGTVLGVLGAAAGYTRSKKSWFLIAAQDTVALRLPQSETAEPGSENLKACPTDGSRAPNMTADKTSRRLTARFSWQLRPVLGQPYVRAGMRELMVQFAPPVASDQPIQVKMCIRSYWRKYNAKTGIVGDVVKRSVSAWVPFDVPYIDTKQRPKVFSIQHLEDLGNGDILVNLEGRFLNGTYIRVGSRIAPITFESDRIRFVASVAELARLPVFVVTRDGSELRLGLDAGCTPASVTPTLSPQGTNAVRLLVRSNMIAKDRLYAVLEGNTAYRPSSVKDGEIVIDVPKDFAVSRHNLELLALLQNSCQMAFDLNPLPQPRKLEFVALSRSPTSAQFLLQGQGSDTAQIVYPQDLRLEPVGERKVLSLNQTQVATLKMLLIRSGEGKTEPVETPQAVPPSPTREPLPVVIVQP